MCGCHRFGPRLQPTLHQIHEGVSSRLRELSRCAQRYRGRFDNRPPDPPDPETELILSEARRRLHRLHAEAQQYLPSHIEYRVREFNSGSPVERTSDSAHH